MEELEGILLYSGLISMIIWGVTQYISKIITWFQGKKELLALIVAVTVSPIFNFMGFLPYGNSIGGYGKAIFTGIICLMVTDSAHNSTKKATNLVKNKINGRKKK